MPLDWKDPEGMKRARITAYSIIHDNATPTPAEIEHLAITFAHVYADLTGVVARNDGLRELVRRVTDQNAGYRLVGILEAEDRAHQRGKRG